MRQRVNMSDLQLFTLVVESDGEIDIDQFTDHAARFPNATRVNTTRQFHVGDIDGNTINYE